MDAETRGLLERVVVLETQQKATTSELDHQRASKHALGNKVQEHQVDIETLEADMTSIKGQLTSMAARLVKIENALLAKGTLVLIGVEIIAGLIQHFSK